jgi:hypothetical protein
MMTDDDVAGPTELYVNIDITIISPTQYNNQLICVVTTPSATSLSTIVAHDPDDAWYIMMIPVPIKKGDTICNESDEEDDEAWI